MRRLTGRISVTTVPLDSVHYHHQHITHPYSRSRSQNQNQRFEQLHLVAMRAVAASNKQQWQQHQISESFVYNYVRKKAPNVALYTIILEFSSASLGTVYILQFSCASLGTVYILEFSSALLGTVYILQFSSASLGTVYILEFSSASLGTIYILEFSSASLGCMCKKQENVSQKTTHHHLSLPVTETVCEEKDCGGGGGGGYCVPPSWLSPNESSFSPFWL